MSGAEELLALARRCRCTIVCLKAGTNTLRLEGPAAVIVAEGEQARVITARVRDAARVLRPMTTEEVRQDCGVN